MIICLEFFVTYLQGGHPYGCTKTQQGLEPLFSILDGVRLDSERRYWIERLEASEDNCDIEEDTGHIRTGVEIVLQMSHNTLTIVEEYVQ